MASRGPCPSVQGNIPSVLKSFCSCSHRQRQTVVRTWCEVKKLFLCSLTGMNSCPVVLVVTSRALQRCCSEEKVFWKMDLSAGRGGCQEKPAQGCLSYACVTVVFVNGLYKSPAWKLSSQMHRHLETFISEQIHELIYPTGIFCKTWRIAFPIRHQWGFGCFSALQQSEL